MQKLSINVGFTCPNRDGSIGKGGCIYCDNRSFIPHYCKEGESIGSQLKKGKEFFGKKYPDMRYMAYFQAYTSTYNTDRLKLLSYYQEALYTDGIEAIIISTRPDCIDTSLLDSLKSLEKKTEKKIMFEIGVESSHDITLSEINRHHTWDISVETVQTLAAYGFDTGVHLIMGLPGETTGMMLQTVEKVVELPIKTIKFHQLQIIKDTQLHHMWEVGTQNMVLFTVEEYLSLCMRIINIMPAHIAIERFTASAPEYLLIAPKWGLKNHEFVDRLNNRLRRVSSQDIEYHK